MKLIIDIGEDYYKSICENGYIYDEDNETIAKIIKDGTLLSEELEKLKGEIEDLDLGFVDEEYQAGIAYGIMKFNQILNKHITELKGEKYG